MELSISDEKTKELLTEVIVELLKTKRDVLYDVVLEALEEVGLANAIAEGRKNDFVSEDDIFSLLDGGIK
jgi:vacuolar-type H+-ATPase subunit D/Vma8